MRLDYYFWNNVKKQGYNDGLVFRPFYKQLIQEGDHKKIDELVNSRTQEILKNQKNQTEKSIERNEYSILSYQRNVESLEDKKSQEIKAIHDLYESNILKNQENYKLYIDSDLSIIKNITDKLKVFYDNINDFTIKSKEDIQNNFIKLTDYVNQMLGNLKNNLEDQGKIELQDNINNYVDNDFSKKMSISKDIALFSFLGILVIFDSILGYKVWINWLRTTPFGADMSSLFINTISIVLSILLVALIIGLTHFIYKEYAATTNKNNKQFFLLFIGMIVFILGLYVKQSAWQLDWVKIFSKENKNIMETILRLFLFPALIGGEILISRINRDNIFFSLRNINKPFRYVNSLIVTMLYNIKNNNIKKAIHQEQKNLNLILESMYNNVNDNITFGHIIKTVDDIKVLLGPIYDNHASKIEEFENKARAIENQKNQSVDQIEQKYIEQINIEDNKILALQNKITETKRQLGDAENEVGSGLKIGLTS